MDLDQTDEQIAQVVQKGNLQAFGLLVERYQAKLLRYAKKFIFDHDDGLDLVQEVFIKAYSNLKSFDPARSFSSWIYRIAHNEFINAIKKKGREPVPFFNPDTIFPHPATQDQADSETLFKDLKITIEECLNDLPPKYREPLVLYFYENMDYQKISEIMHIPTSTVGIRLKRGKQALQKIYKQRHPNL